MITEAERLWKTFQKYLQYSVAKIEDQKEAEQDWENHGQAVGQHAFMVASADEACKLNVGWNCYANIHNQLGITPTASPQQHIILVGY